MHTEDQARELWCPKALDWEPVNDYPVTFNRYATPDEGARFSKACRCIASRCAVWRWAGWVNLQSDGSFEQNETRHGPYVMPRGPTQNKHGCVRVGYCGLAR